MIVYEEFCKDGYDPSVFMFEWPSQTFKSNPIKT